MPYSGHFRFVWPFLIFCLVAGCGGDSASSSARYTSTDAAPTWTTPTDIGVNDPIVILFDQSIDTGSLSLSGTLAELVAAETWSRAAGTDDTLTLTPPAEGWYSGHQDLSVTVQDRSGRAATQTTNFAVRLKFDNFQAASVVIGQTTFTGKAANQGGAAAADTLNTPAGDPMVIDGRLWIADTNNNRILGYGGIPSANGASASWVIGQSTFSGSDGGTTASALNLPVGFAYDGSTFYVSDAGNNRILAYDGVPLSAPGVAGHVLGQADLTSSASDCSATTLHNPDAMTAVAGKLIVADWTNNRVLIWNDAPAGANAVPPDIVLGQSDFTHCTWRDDNQDNVDDSTPTARTMTRPSGVWSDGERLLVADTLNHRVLVWNSFPTTNFQPADVVIGKDDFVSDLNLGVNARTFGSPEHVWSNGLQVIVTDHTRDRVMIWNDFPTANYEPADIVLGHSNFTSEIANDDDEDATEDANPTARTLKGPWGVAVYRNKLLVSETGNHRVLVFESR